MFDKQVDLSSALSLKWLAPALLLVGAVVIYALPDSVDVPGCGASPFAAAVRAAC
ncbi:MAG: hypothetical protein QM749_05845 [Aquabacterium sp.]